LGINHNHCSLVPLVNVWNIRADMYGYNKWGLRMSLAYCRGCLEKIDECKCELAGDPPHIYGEIRVAIARDRRARVCEHCGAKYNEEDLI